MGKRSPVFLLLMLAVPLACSAEADAIRADASRMQSRIDELAVTGKRAFEVHVRWAPPEATPFDAPSPARFGEFRPAVGHEEFVVGFCVHGVLRRIESIS